LLFVLSAKLRATNKPFKLFNVGVNAQASNLSINIAKQIQEKIKGLSSNKHQDNSMNYATNLVHFSVSQNIVM
jgi:hypothetical protein